MAEVIARNYLDRLGPEAAGIKVISAGAGAAAGDPPSPAAQQAMRELGMKLTAHRARNLTPELLRAADVVLVMTARHKDQALQLLPQAADKVWRLTEYGADAATKMEIRDPFGQSLE